MHRLIDLYKDFFFKSISVGTNVNIAVFNMVYIKNRMIS